MSQWVLSVVQHVCQASLTPKSLTTIYANFDRLRGNSSEHQARVQEKEAVKVAKIYSIMSFWHSLKNGNVQYPQVDMQQLH